MVSPRTMLAQHEVLNRTFSAGYTVPFSAGFVFTFVAIPVSFRDRFHLGFEAVHVVSSVASVAQEKFVFVVPALTELTVL